MCKARWCCVVLLPTARSHAILQTFLRGESIVWLLLKLTLNLSLITISAIERTRSAMPASACVSRQPKPPHTHKRRDGRRKQDKTRQDKTSARSSTGLSVVAVVGGVFVEKGRDKLIHWVACQNQIVHCSRGISVGFIRLVPEVGCDVGGGPTRLHRVAIQPARAPCNLDATYRVASLVESRPFQKLGQNRLHRRAAHLCVYIHSLRSTCATPIFSQKAQRVRALPQPCQT